MPVTTKGVSGNSVSTTTNDYGRTVGSASHTNEKNQSVNVGSTRDANRGGDLRSGGKNNIAGSTYGQSTNSIGQGVLYSQNSSVPRGLGKPNTPATPPVPDTPPLTFNPQLGAWTASNQPTVQTPLPPAYQYSSGLSSGDLQSWLLSLKNVAPAPSPMSTLDYLQYVQPNYRGGM